MVITFVSILCPIHCNEEAPHQIKKDNSNSLYHEMRLDHYLGMGLFFFFSIIITITKLPRVMEPHYQHFVRLSIIINNK